MLPSTATALTTNGLVSPIWYFGDVQGTRPLNVRRVTAEYLVKGIDNVVTNYNTRPMTFTAAAYPTLTNGYLRITNLLNGYAIKVTFSDSFNDTSVTNYFGTNVTGNVNANEYLTTFIDYRAGRAINFYGPYFGTSNYTTYVSEGGSGTVQTNISYLSVTNAPWVSNYQSSVRLTNFTASAYGSAGTKAWRAIDNLGVEQAYINDEGLHLPATPLSSMDEDARLLFIGDSGYVSRATAIPYASLSGVETMATTNGATFSTWMTGIARAQVTNGTNTIVSTNFVGNGANISNVLAAAEVGELNITLPPYNAVGDGLTINSNATYMVNLVCSTSTVPPMFFVPQGAFVMNNLTGGLAGWSWRGQGFSQSALLYNTNIVSSGDQQNAKFFLRNEFGPSWIKGLRFDGQAYLTNFNTAQSGTTNVYKPRDDAMERNGIFMGANTNMPSVLEDFLCVNFNGHAVYVRGRYDNFGNGTVNKAMQIRNGFFTNNFNPILCDDAGTSDYVQLSNLRADNSYVAMVMRGGNIAANNLVFTRQQVGIWSDNSRFHESIGVALINHSTTALIIKDATTTATWSGIEIRGGGDIALWGTTSNQWFQGINVQGGNFIASTTTSNNVVKNCHFNTIPTVRGGGIITFVPLSCTTDVLGYGSWPKNWVQIRDSLPNNTAPHNTGTPSAGNWTNRWFNTLDGYGTFCITNTGTGNSGSNSFTITEPGNYFIRASSTAYNSSRTKLMLSNVTTAAISVLGQNFYAGSASVQVNPTLSGRFTCTASNVFVLRQYFENNAATGFGIALNTATTGVTEDYTIIEITKE